MGQNTVAFTRNAVKTPTNVVGPRLAKALRECLGLGQPGGMPCKQLAREMGVDTDTVYGWAAGNGIRGEHLFALICRMPATFGSMVFDGTGVMVLKPQETQRKVEVAIAEHRRVTALIQERAERGAQLAADIQQIAGKGRGA